MVTKKLLPCFALILGILLLQPSPVSSEGAGETLVATVRSYDPDARTIDLLTGCGHALRVVKISLGSDAKLAQKGRTVQLYELKPGTIVRVQFQRSKDLYLAQSVEVEALGGGR